MKIRQLSDLHCEGYQYEYEHKGEDVLVLAGDIHTRNRHEQLVMQVPDSVQILFVAGNHEYYNSVFEDVNQYLSDLSKQYPNFHFLNNTGVKIGDVEFFGGTMYSDFGLYGQELKRECESVSHHGIMDFYKTRRRWTRREDDVPDSSTRLWSTRDHVQEHDKFKYELQGWVKLTEGSKRVVISHFVPSPQAIHPRWGSSMLNAYFTCDMEQFMGWEGLWLYGHTHDSNDFMVGDTRVVGNPRGYGSENAGGFNNNLILEI